MIEITGPKQKAAWLSHSLPPVEQVAPLVWSVPVRCDEFPIRYTLCYLVANEAGEFVVIDPGLDSPEGRAELLAGIDEAGLSIPSMVGILVTHFHPDHLGMAHHLSTLNNVWVAMHPTELARVDIDGRIEDRVAEDQVWLIENGVPADEAPAVGYQADSIERYRAEAEPDLLLQDGNALPLAGRDLRVIWTPGHTAGHLCVIDNDSKLIFTGDHILPRITPNVSRDFHDDYRDPIAEYEGSLEKVKQWDAYEVCPAHEYRFRGLAERCDELAKHQADRSAEVAALLEGENSGRSPWEVASLLTWSRGWDGLNARNRRSALGETMAHLQHLVSTRA